MPRSGHAALRSADQGAAFRKRILAAAKKCFVEYGFYTASMASIAETAEMSAGLIYRYFESKDAIILAIIEQQLHENRASIARLQSSHDIVVGL
ncbi:hypothetical protein B2J88_48645 [Rhodococcus sp. SRB_17]|uniref:TetR/AcrR family transcriptional regulator n=1 Tax=Acidovorax sp. SRB_24 TaxID=1962700 RepID=UPI001ED5665B|nr:helix-turn-helix domain-containing protein [Acidovorax sp. SRB_24]NMM78326.1 hypothetical protein [Acidovorax sp. SRB_24]NMM92046.1 hypothetical protein [Rhodococcus sp. SRB_17]